MELLSCGVLDSVALKIFFLLDPLDVCHFKLYFPFFYVPHETATSATLESFADLCVFITCFFEPSFLKQNYSF